MTEFDLSEKIYGSIDLLTSEPRPNYLKLKDVKEFIKKLKEIIESEIFEIKNTNYEGCNKVKDEIIKEIDKLAGKDLK